MRRLFCLLVVLAAIGIAQAGNLIVNGDFEQGSLGWTAWHGGNSAIGVADLIDPTNLCGGVWWSDDGMLQDVTVGPGVYEFGGDLMRGSDYPLADRKGVIVAEMGDGFDIWWTQQVEVLPLDPVGVWLAGKPEAGYPNSMIIDNSTAGATHIRINMFLIDDGASPTGNTRFDNVYLGLEGIASQAKFPAPYSDEVVVPGIDDISWATPDPNYIADIVTCDVYFEPNDVDPYTFSSAPIATGVTNGTVNLTSAGVTIVPNTIYTWRVDCTDLNQGDPITTTGDVWFFKVSNDEAPVANAGGDQYDWLDMNDGDGDPTKVTVTMAGNVTDDSVSTLTTIWSLIYSEQDPATTVNITAAGSPTTTVEINGTGLFRFQLDADDAYSHSDDTIDIFITDTACQAAQLDPLDPYHSYTYVGDTNDDCYVNLTDFANLAATWLECLTDKITCTP